MVPKNLSDTFFKNSKASFPASIDEDSWNDMITEHYLKTELYEYLKKNNTIFDFLQDAILDGIWYWDLENSENEWMNEKFWEIMGYDPKIMPQTPKSWQKVMQEDDLKTTLINFQKHLEDENHPYDQTVRYFHRDGRIIWIRCRGKAIRDQNGKPIRMLGIHTIIPDYVIRIEELNRQNTILSMVNKFQQNILSESSSNHLFNSAMQNLLDFTESEHGFIAQIENDTKGQPYLKIKTSTHPNWIDLKIPFTNENPGEGEFFPYLLNKVIQTRKPIFENHFSSSPQSGAFINSTFLPNNFLGIPLFLGSDFVGFIGLANRLRGFEDPLIKDLEPFINTLSQFIEVQRSKQALAETETRLLNTIKELQEKNKDLQRATTLLNGAQRIANMGAWELDLSTEQTFWTDEVYTIHEVGKDFEHNKVNGIEFYHPEDRPIITQAITQTIEKRIPYDVKCRFITAKGNHIWVRASGYPVINEGRVTHLIGLFQDITKQETSNQALLRSESKLKEILNAIDDGIWSVSWPDFNILYLSPSIGSIYGYSIEEILENPMLWQEVIHPEDQPSIEKSFQALQKNNISITEKRIIRKDGKVVWVQDKSYLIYDHGKPIKIVGVISNITERKQLELKLKQFYDIAENIQLGLHVYHLEDLEDDSTLRMTYANPTTELMTGLKVQDVLGHTLDENFPYLRDLNVPQRYADVVRSKAHKNFEDIFYNDHRVIQSIYSVKAFPLPGNHVGVAFENITEKKLSILELQKTKDLLTRTNQVARIGGWEVDLHTGHHTWTEIMREIHEVGPDFVPNQENVFQFCKDEQTRNVLIATIKHSLETFESFDIEFQIRTAKGKELWVRCIGQIEFDGDKPIRHSGTFLDIDSEKKSKLQIQESEARYRSYIDNAPDGIFIVNGDGFYLEVNEAGCAMTGYTKEEILSMSITDFLFEDCLEDGIKLFKQVKEMGKTAGELPFKHKDGSKRWWSITAVQLKPSHILGFTKDITESKLIANSLSKAKEEAEKANRAKTEFLANMSHEIRTPLSGVIGFLELLKNTPLSSLQEQYVDNANASGHTLLKVINGILDFSKVESGMLELEIIQTDMIELLKNCVEIVRYTADKKNLVLSLDLDKKIARFGMTDPIRLKQILTNLLSNAVKFTSQGKVELKVQFEKLSENQGKYHFSVRDTGIGITDEQKDKLFKAFSQADSSTTRRFGGTGLGLVISEMIANKLNSKINFDSKHGEGSNFWFEIITEVKEGVEITPFSQSNFQINTSKDIIGLDNKVHILIVDDEPMNTILLKAVLSQIAPKAQFIEASTGKEGLKKYEDNRPELIFMDIQMPDMDGLEATQKIRELERNKKTHVPIIAFTAGAFKADEEKCLASGMDDFITKPTTITQLKMILQKYLFSPSSEAIQEI
jgi:PAS domain S-box-containing protein